MSGKELAAKQKEDIRNTLGGCTPTLAVILVGDDPASCSYVRGKEKDCAECGIRSEMYRLSDTISESELLALIDSLNNRNDVHGILVQLPLPKHFDKRRVLERISPNKDVDCFCFRNVGRLYLNDPVFMPCTPSGILDLLREYKVDVSGKDCVVIGRSDIVGKPMATLLMQMGGTVTVCHSGTNNLAEHTRKADIIVCAVGRPKFLTADMVKDGAVVVDVGINRDADGKICGDVDFEHVSEKCSAITPVPGSVGLMTRVALMKNTVKAYALVNGSNSTSN